MARTTPGSRRRRRSVLRLFVALELPGGVRTALHGWAAEAAPDGVPVVPAASLHLTLAFIGPRDGDAVPRVGALLRSVTAEPGVLTTDGALWLPPRRPGVLTVAVRAGRALGALQEAVAAGLVEAVALEREARAFRPHVTVGRVRRGARVPVDVAAPPSLTFRAAALTLFGSMPAPGGSRYEALERVPLATGR